MSDSKDIRGNTWEMENGDGLVSMWGSKIGGLGFEPLGDCGILESLKNLGFDRKLFSTNQGLEYEEFCFLIVTIEEIFLRYKIHYVSIFLFESVGFWDVVRSWAWSLCSVFCINCHTLLCSHYCLWSFSLN